MKKYLIPGLLLVLTAALSIAAYLLLPDTVVTQFSLGGSGVTTMPKLLAIMLPAALGVLGACLLLPRDGSKAKGTVAYLLSVAVFVLTILVNR